MSDILKDPDAELEKGLKAEDHETAAYVLHALVKHMEAGGVVPKRLRAKGTAVGELLDHVAIEVGNRVLANKAPGPLADAAFAVIGEK